MSKADVRGQAITTEEWLDTIDQAEPDFRDAVHLRRLMEANERVTAAQDALRDAVADARAAGDSWAAIGMALGISKQAAHERFRDLGRGPEVGVGAEATRQRRAASDHRDSKRSSMT